MKEKGYCRVAIVFIVVKENVGFALELWFLPRDEEAANNRREQAKGHRGGGGEQMRGGRDEEEEQELERLTNIGRERKIEQDRGKADRIVRKLDDAPVGKIMKIKL